MIERIRQLLIPPIIDDDEVQNLRARLLNSLFLIYAVASGTTPGTLRLIPGGALNLTGEIVTYSLSGIAIICFILTRYRKIRLASLVFVFTYYIGMTIYLLSTPEVLGDPFRIAFIVALVLAALLLEQRDTIIMTAVIMATQIGLYLYSPETFSIPELVPNLIAYALAGLLVSYAPNILAASLLRLREQNTELIRLTEEQEAIVRERTSELTLAFDVTNTVTRIRDIQELLASAVELIRERFNLYYVQIYLAEATGQSLTLQAGTGSAGAELVRRGFRLPIDLASINGAAANQREPVLVPNTMEDQLFRPNSLLPDTRSELSVPLITGERVVGVLDLQSSQPNFFSTAQLPAFQILANLLATAIESANLFTEVTQTQEELMAQAQRLAQSNWNEYLSTLETVQHLRYTHGQKETPNVSVTNGHTHTAPISLVGHEIGVIEIDTAPNYHWTEDDAELVKSVADQVAQQVENFRLLYEAERFRIEAEEAVRSLTREGWQTYAETLPNYGYRYHSGEIEAVSGDTSRLAPPILRTPLHVRGEKIGELSLGADGDINEEAVNLTSAVAGRLSTHLESLRLNQQTELALAETRRLYDISSQLNQANTLQEAIDAAARPAFANNAIGATLTLFELDQAGNPEWAVLSAVVSTQNLPFPVGARFYLPDLEMSRLFLPNSAMLVGNTQNDDRLDLASSTVLQAANVFAGIFLPLAVGALQIGILTIYWPEPQTFTASDARLYDAVAVQTSAVINGQLLLQQIQDALAETAEQARQLASLNELSALLGQMDTIDEVFDNALRYIESLLPDTRAFIAVRESDGRHFIIRATQETFSDAPMGAKIAVRGSIMGQAVQENKVLMIPDLKKTDFVEKGLSSTGSIRSAIAVPMITQSGLIAVFNITSAKPNTFDQQDENIVAQMGALLTATIENRLLLDDARARAQREQILREITEKVRSSTNVDTIIRTAASEIGRALGRKTVVYLQDHEDGQ